MQRLIRLPDRLMAIASFIHRGASVADIGTDHGFLPVYLAQNGLARSIIASDISAGSLEAARRSATNYGVTDKITFIVAPGLSGIKETDVDTIVIAGLGGETIAAILNEAPWAMYSDIKLILQPQSKIDKLCCFLYENDYSINNAKLALDNSKFYVVAQGDGSVVFADVPLSSILPEAGLLSLLVENRDPLFMGYIDKLIGKTRRALDSMKKSSEFETRVDCLGYEGSNIKATALLPQVFCSENRLPDTVAIMSSKLSLYIKLKEKYENANCK